MYKSVKAIRITAWSAEPTSNSRAKVVRVIMQFYRHLLNKAKIMISYTNERPKISSVQKYSFSNVKYIERFIWSRILNLDKVKRFKKSKKKQWKKHNQSTIKRLEGKTKLKDFLFYKTLSTRGNFNFKSIKLLLNNLQRLGSG